MLVEHKKKLRRLKKGEEYREKPILDEQEIERLNYLLKKSIEQNLPVKIIYYKDGTYQEATGKIIKYLTTPIYSILLQNRGEEQFLEIDSIIDIKS